MRELDYRLIQAKPSKKQIDYLDMGFVCFIHYNMNTYTGREWGDGKEDTYTFAPEQVDTDEWVQAAKSAGMKGIILTCKHHDGFCLWPSKYTEHSIKNTNYKNGEGDIVRELSDSCRKYDMKFGVYLSPWDRNSKYYGTGKAYDDYYISQLTELLTNYGDIFVVWLDGACGENEAGHKQVYDWNRYFDVARKLQPNAMISICGPDIRWVGNEAGQARVSEWSVVSERMRHPEYTQEDSQKSDDTSFRERRIDPMKEDLGSRDVLKDEEEFIFYPSEMDVSIRPGWFYHTEEDDKVRDADNLFEIYLKSVGHNSTFLLNIPPMPDGHLNKVDIDNLRALGEKINKEFSNNIVSSAKISSVPELDDNENDINHIFTSKESSFIGNEGNPKLEILLEWDEAKSIKYVVIQEDISCSQRIEQYKILGKDASERWIELYKGTTVGYKEIVPLDSYCTSAIKIQIDDSRVSPTIQNIEVYSVKNP